MRAPRRKPGPKPWKRIPGVVQRVHRTPTEWREIMARFRASGQSKTKFCERNAIARSTLILWERSLAAGDDGGTPARNAKWFVEIEDDGDEAPPPRGSGLFAEVTDAGALVTDPESRRGAGGLEWCAGGGAAVYCTHCQHGSCLLPSPAPLAALRTENANLAERLAAATDRLTTLVADHEALKADCAALKHQLDWFRRQLFGRRSEKQIPFDPTEQASLFEALGVEPASAPVAVEEISYRRRRKKQRGDAATHTGLRFDASVPVTTIEVRDPAVEAIPEAERERIGECCIPRSLTTGFPLYSWWISAGFPTLFDH